MQKETARHREAFEYYYELGDKRSLLQVSRRFAVSEVSAKKWSSDFGWQSRVEYRDKEIADAFEKIRIREWKKHKNHYYLIVQKGIQLFQERLIAGKIEIKTFAEFEKMIKVGAFLNEESFEMSISNNITVNVPDEEDDD